MCNFTYNLAILGKNEMDKGGRNREKKIEKWERHKCCPLALKRLMEKSIHCPLCLEELDQTDLSLKPCLCGYQVSCVLYFWLVLLHSSPVVRFVCIVCIIFENNKMGNVLLVEHLIQKTTSLSPSWTHRLQQNCLVKG